MTPHEIRPISNRLFDRLRYSRKQNLKPNLGTLFYYTADVMLD